jgi:peptide/nickel transport system substrate-binding protein
VSIRAAFVGALAAATLVAGCGGGGATEFPAPGPPAAGGGGELAYAIPAAPGGLDPLAASTIAAQTVSRQIFEPLVARLDGPYRRGTGVPGIALAARHSDDFRVWSLPLRPGVSFQDGSLVAASAVLVNARRWRTSAVGRQLLPGLVAADGPRPDLVRFVFAGPVEDLLQRLADPRLGLVSPNALLPQSGLRASLLRAGNAGSGPFKLASRPRGAVVLTRNRGWWGSSHGLGPALDGVRFRAVAGRGQRVELLRAGKVQVAGDIGAAAARLDADPLLASIAAGSAYAIGLERSVHGLSGLSRQSLSEIWLTSINAG